jgi:cytochrome c-type biogenesis protein CcmH/NrfG
MKPALALLFLASVAFALVPADLHNEDVLVAALYHSEPFQNVQSHVPNTLEDSRAKLQSLVAANPERAEMYQALATVDENRGDFASAEKRSAHFRRKKRKSLRCL